MGSSKTGIKHKAAESSEEALVLSWEGRMRGAQRKISPEQSSTWDVERQQACGRQSGNVNESQRPDSVKNSGPSILNQQCL